MDLFAAIKAAQDIDKFVGIVAGVARKLKAQPDVAVVKLSQAFGEVAKTLQVVDRATSDYLSLGIDDGALSKNAKLLLEIDGGVADAYRKKPVTCWTSSSRTTSQAHVVEF